MCFELSSLFTFKTIDKKANKNDIERQTIQRVALLTIPNTCIIDNREVQEINKNQIHPNYKILSMLQWYLYIMCFMRPQVCQMRGTC